MAAFFLFSMRRAPSPEMLGERETALPAQTRVIPRYATPTAFSLLQGAFRPPIVVLWRMMMTAFASVLARSATVVACGCARAGSVCCVDARPALSVRSNKRYGVLEATPIGNRGSESEAAASTPEAGVRRWWRPSPAAEEDGAGTGAASASALAA
jgi:hypothetical protein